MPETFESDEGHDEEYGDEGQDFAPSSRGRKPKDDVPDGPVENAHDIPLLTHAGTGKANTITYLKVIRLDGPPGVRGMKGKLSPESTWETLARRFGNGTYTIEGCNYKHKMLAREENLEIAIPGFDLDATKPAAPASGANGGAVGLHALKMVTDMAKDNQSTVSEQAKAQVESTRDMASSTMALLTEFTAAQRASERESAANMQANMQAFFASMMTMQQQNAATTLQMMQTAHAQQMELVQASTRNDDSQSQLEVFMKGMQLAMSGELGGNDDEPWLAALKEGSGMIGNLAQLAQHGPAQGRPAALPAAPTAAPPPAPRGRLPARNPRPEGEKRKRRLPFKKDELRGIAKLRATLRSRGVDFEQFLTEANENFQQVPDDQLYESDDGPEGSEASANNETSAGHETET